MSENIRYARTQIDPTKLDTDDDGYEDSIDANPDKNPDRIYLFVNPDGVDNGLSRSRIYTDAGYDVKFAKFYDKDSFINLWNSIGIKDKAYYYDQTDWQGKYWYNAKYVNVMSHGSPEGFALNSVEDSTRIMFITSSKDVSDKDRIDKRLYVYPRELENRRIDTLVLSSCSTAGKTSYQHNVAESIYYYHPEINQIIAPDTILLGDNHVDWFISYSRLYVCDRVTLDNLIYHSTLSPVLYYLENYEKCDEVKGFVLFSRTEGMYIDYYSSDVWEGTLSCTEDSLDGVIGFDVIISDEIKASGNSFDPIIQRRG